MDPDSEVERIFRPEIEDEEEETKKWKRPPSSYGSMKSDEKEDEEEENNGDVIMVLPETAGTRLQLNRPESPETLYTATTEQTKPPGALVIETGSCELEDLLEEAEEDIDDDNLVTNSPEPPEPVEPEDEMQADENSQPGRLHPEQDLPHIFRTIQNILTGLTKEELLKFKMMFYQWQPGITFMQVMEGDILDFVDKIMEILGQDRCILHTITTLQNVNMKDKADELEEQCKRAWIRYYLKQYAIRYHQVIREGVPRPGKQHLLGTIYVEPQISTCPYGGVDPSHEFRPYPSLPSQVPSASTFVSVNDLFRMQTCDGKPVRTVLTTGIPGIGLTVSVAKFSMDWAELHANRDVQFVIGLSFSNLWYLRNKGDSDLETVSIMDVIEYYYPECKDMKYLEEEDCKFVIIMDSFDCYQAPLEWEKAPVINDNYTKTHMDNLVVNIIRGTVLRGARVWILGRAAAVSQIPSQFIDAFTEALGFSDEMKDNFLTRRFDQAVLAANIVAHSKRLPTLRQLTRHPFICWMVATVFERCYSYEGYGVHPPRLTPFYAFFVIVQINRRLQFYYGKNDNDLKWSSNEKHLLLKLGKMAFKLLERNTFEFFEEDMKEYDLNLMDVTVFSGLCTELPSTQARKRIFCFLHVTFQEFMAALYVFTMFRAESNNVLDSRVLPKLSKSKSPVDLIQCAVTRTLKSPFGQYDIFLRFLCGLLNEDGFENQLGGCLYQRRAPKLSGLDEVQHLLEQAIQSAKEERVENLKECLREMMQEDE
ncbi:protein NLRC3 [Mastacembelus armatus]|uniref:NLR family, CARD domain containing 3-like n=1 Tax=Mastacembelus armatus TaxID=205130 RepID=A0A7N8X8F6_9TELE|nr:protein NLRC3-like [Mastacembelus armatus]